MLFATLLGAAACGNRLTPERQFELQVTGVPGTPLVGEYIVTVGNSTTREKIDRKVPFSIAISAHSVSAAVQKLGTRGTVRMQLSVNGTPISFDYTDEPYGSARVSTP